jgi:hypothetical protein
MVSAHYTRPYILIETEIKDRQAALKTGSLSDEPPPSQV